MGYSFDIDHERKIVLYTHSGYLETSSIGMAWNELLHIEEFAQGCYNLLSDYRNSDFHLNKRDEIDSIVDFLYKIKHILKGKKQALIVDNPLNTALSILFEEKATKKIGFIVKVFSTKVEAIKWLLV